MKIYHQHTNNIDKKYIREASLLKTQTEAEMRGWKKLGTGKNKIVYKKGMIVVKFAKKNRSEHLLREVKKYFAVPKYYRKYFARIFAGDRSKIIQRYIPIKIIKHHTGRECMMFDILKEKLQVWDCSLWHNVSIINNKVIIYDFGY